MAQQTYQPKPAINVEVALAEAFQPLARCGFPVEAWTPAVVLRTYVPIAKFIDTIKILSKEGDEGMMDAMVQQGGTLNYWTLVASATPLQLYKFCQWLRSDAGIKFTVDRRRRRALEKKVVGAQSLTDVGMVSGLIAQSNELAILRKQTRSAAEELMTELRRQLNLARDKLEADLRALEADYSPASQYVPMDDAELGQACWSLYEADCAARDRQPDELTNALLDDVRVVYGGQATANHQTQFMQDQSRRNDLKVWLEEKVLELESVGDSRQASSFAATWKVQVEEWLMKFELKLRLELLQLVVYGVIVVSGARRSTRPISSLDLDRSVWRPATRGIKNKPPLSVAAEEVEVAPLSLGSNTRLSILIQPRAMKGARIPTARSRFEAKVRKVIGGGEMRNWRVDSAMYRGGGNYSDSLKLLASASEQPPGMLLRDEYEVEAARKVLRLPCGLKVPRGRECCVIKNFNEDATAGPALRAFGIRRKAGMKVALEDLAWSCYQAYAEGKPAEKSLPFISARVGYRTKLMPLKDAYDKLGRGQALGRCVMMLDAHEQAFSTPLYNVISAISHRGRYARDSPFRNTTIRASSDWARMWEEVQEAKCIVELDWKKFDRERPAEDIQFIIDTVISCFTPQDEFEERLLDGYRIMMERALINRPFITDDGGVFTIEGMVPSGSLWTGWLDTALNALYIEAVLWRMGHTTGKVVAKCAGDDNLTLFYVEASDDHLQQLRILLNEWFRAGIEEDEFLIHRPPYHVTRKQAVFPLGTDLSKGTSHILDQAYWADVGDEMIIDEATGYSHRWKYVFEGKPKFLSCYWDIAGNPIRPAHINLEKLLWPEGIHETIDDYEAALISMAVDNPFNHHNVNHLMHRYCIVQQVKRLSACGLKPDHILSLSHFRSKGGEEVPFPMIAQWRRVEGWVDMEQLPFVKYHMDRFRDFVSGVTSLYARNARGGLDAWRFMDIIRNFEHVGPGQFGNELADWLSFLKSHPVSRYLRPTRGAKRPRTERPATPEVPANFDNFVNELMPHRRRAPFKDVDSYAAHIARRIRHPIQS
ncbi:TPA_asm: fusion protein [Phelipanche aegyptiaca amalgavirus 1]|nr:TPA_asm: fusion protein [Phelipanche aegyptiaca amalgavirus 1]